MRVVAIIQARMGSSRLPGKVMMPIAGKPMLAHVVNKAKMLNVDEVVIATTTNPFDYDIAEWCRPTKPSPEWIDPAKALCFRGPENDVLKRYLLAANEYNAEVIVRITADCPLLDSFTSNKVIEAFKFQEVDYASNVWPERTFPRGWDIEVFSYGALLLAYSGTQDPTPLHQEWREHVTPWMQRYLRIFNYKSDTNRSAINFSVDTQEDLDRVRKILV